MALRWTTLAVLLSNVEGALARRLISPWLRNTWALLVARHGSLRHMGELQPVRRGSLRHMGELRAVRHGCLKYTLVWQGHLRDTHCQQLVESMRQSQPVLAPLRAVVHRTAPEDVHQGGAGQNACAWGPRRGFQIQEGCPLPGAAYTTPTPTRTTSANTTAASTSAVAGRWCVSRWSHGSSCNAVTITAIAVAVAVFSVQEALPCCCRVVRAGNLLRLTFGEVCAAGNLLRLTCGEACGAGLQQGPARLQRPL